ncbi:MAG: hypothetical protein AAF108_05905 [Planctomycetota bacterium]
MRYELLHIHISRGVARAALALVGAAAIAVPQTLAGQTLDQSARQPPDPGNTLTLADPSTHRAVADVLLGSESSDERRQAAAIWLLQTVNRPETVRVLQQTLHPDAPTQARAALCRALSECRWAPSSVGDMLLEALGALPAEERPPLLRALRASPSLDVLAALIPELAQDRSEAVREAAVETLVALTGRDDLGRDQGAWLAWFDTLPDVWSVRAVETLRSGRLEADRDAVVLEAKRRSALVEAYSDLIRAQDASGRDGFLASLLRSDLPEAWTAGLNGAKYAHADAGETAPLVAEAIRDLLRSQNRAKRREAARFIQSISLPVLIDDVRRALLEERDPVAARSLLIAVSTEPSPEVFATVERWMRADVGTRAAAAMVAAELARRRMISPEQSAVLRSIYPATNDPSQLDGLSQAELAMLAVLGLPEDIDGLIARLNGPHAARRREAALALAESPHGVAALIEASRGDPSLVSIAISAVTRFRPTQAGVGDIVSLPTTPETLPALRRIASQIALPQVVTLGSSIDLTPEQRLAVLQTLTGRSTAPADAETLARGLTDLAELHLQTGDAAAAVTVLDGISDGSDRKPGTITRLVALLSLGDHDAARDLGADRDQWEAALSHPAIGSSHAAAREVYDEIFGAPSPPASTDEELPGSQDPEASPAGEPAPDQDPAAEPVTADPGPVDPGPAEPGTEPDDDG